MDFDRQRILCATSTWRYGGVGVCDVAPTLVVRRWKDHSVDNSFNGICAGMLIVQGT